MTVKGLINYLRRFEPGLKVEFMVGDNGKHVLYKVDRVAGITDQGYPLIMIACDGEEVLPDEDNLREPEGKEEKEVRA